MSQFDESDAMSAGADADIDDTMSELAAQQESDSQLFEHNRRFQAAVLRTMEKQIAQMEEVTLAKDRELQSSEKVREDLAISWSQMRTELQRLNKSSASMNTQLRTREHLNATLKGENEHLVSENEGHKKVITELNAELNRLRLDLTATRDELHSGKQLHQIFTSDITMHRQLKENLSTEIRNQQVEMKKRQAYTDELYTKYEKSNTLIQELRTALDQQISETKQCENTVAKVTHELGLLQTERNIMMKQWSDAIHAMQRRDITMNNVKGTKEMIESELITIRTSEQGLSKELQEERKKTNTYEITQSELTEKYDELLRLYKDLQQSYLQQQKSYEAVSREKIDEESRNSTLTKQNASLQTENQRLKQHASSINDTLKLTTAKYQEQSDLNQKINTSVRESETIKLVKVESELSEVKLRNIQLENEKQFSINQAIELREQLKEFSNINRSLNDSHQITTQANTQLQKESNQQSIALEHMTYRANKSESEVFYLRTTKEDKHRNEQISLQGNIHSLQMSLQKKQDEVARMNHAFILAEEKVIEAQRVHAEIQTRTERLKEELKKSEGVKDRLKSTVDSLQQERGVILKENDLTRLEVRKNEAKMSDLITENVSLKSQLEEERFKTLERREMYESEIAKLKAEIIPLRGGKLGHIDSVTTTQRGSDIWQRKYEHEVMKYESLQKEHTHLASLLFSEKQKNKSDEKLSTQQERSYQIWLKSFEAMFEKQNAKIRSGQSSGVNVAAALLSSGTTQNGTKKSPSAKQVLDNFYSTQSSLPTSSAGMMNGGFLGNGASISGKAGASIMNGGGGGASSSSSPAMDALNEMMTHMQKHGVAMIPAAQAQSQYPNGSLSARVLSDSDSRSSLLQRDSGPHGKRSSTFTESLVSELRASLHSASILAEQRGVEVTRLKQELKLALQEATDSTAREGSLLQKLHIASTQLQSMSLKPMDFTEEKNSSTASMSVSRHGRTARVGLGRSTPEGKKGGGGDSSASLYGGGASIASTASLTSSIGVDRAASFTQLSDVSSTSTIRPIHPHQHHSHVGASSTSSFMSSPSLHSILDGTERSNQNSFRDLPIAVHPASTTTQLHHRASR